MSSLDLDSPASRLFLLESAYIIIQSHSLIGRTGRFNIDTRLFGFPADIARNTTTSTAVSLKFTTTKSRQELGFLYQ